MGKHGKTMEEHHVLNGKTMEDHYSEWEKLWRITILNEKTRELSMAMFNSYCDTTRR